MRYAHPTVLARVALYRKICEAVESVHRKMVVHRDLKPGNILVAPDGSPKLLDFGMAKLLEGPKGGQATLTAAGLQPMTPDYAAREQVLGQAITAATDVYALGPVLYKLLTGSRPHRFTENTPLGWAQAICEMSLRQRRRTRRGPPSLPGSAARARPAGDVALSRRNRAAVAVGSVAVLGLIGTSLYALAQAREATQRFNDVRVLAKSFLFDLKDELAR